MNTQSVDVGKNLNVLRIIVAAMAMGMIALTVVLQVLPSNDQSVDPTIMAVVLNGMTIMELGAFTIMRKVMFANTRKKLESDGGDPKYAVNQVFMSYTIISGAMAEGIGLFGAVAAYICNERLFLIAPAVALVALMIVFPTAGRFASCYESVTGNPLPASDWPQ